MAQVLIFASTSGIAQAVAEEFLRRGYSLVLAARNADNLERQARDLKVKFEVEIPTVVWDLSEVDGHRQKVEALFEQHPIEGVFLAPGIMPPQEECEQNPASTMATIDVNFTAVGVLLNLFAEKLEAKGRGFISCLSSVAGDRGRQSNYVYGAAKAGLSAYLQGMRNRLYKHGVLVQTVKPGPVKTPMTSHLDDSPLMADPQQVAKDIVNAIERRQDILYTPFFWRYIMSAIKWIPESIFKRMSL